MAKKLNQSLGALAALGALGYQLSRGNNKAPVEDRGTMSPMPTTEADAAVGSGAQGGGAETSEDTGDFLSRRLKVNPEDGKAYSTDNLSPMSGARAASGPAKAPSGKAATDAAAAFRASERAGRSASTGTASTKPGTMDAYKSRAGIGARETGVSTQPGTMGAYKSRAGTRAGGDMPYSPPPTTAEMRKQAEAQAIQRVYPEEYLAGGPGLKTMHSAAKALANRKPGIAEISQQALPAPTKRLTGPSKSDLTARDRASRAATREEEMLRENAANYGLNPKAPGYEAASRAMREKLGGSDFTLKKNGGAVKTKKMASGGMTSNFQRADGIASKGKTKCKIY